MFLLFCREFNVEAGLAINPTTSLQLIKDSLKSIDFVLLMAINPGITNKRKANLRIGRFGVRIPAGAPFNLENYSYCLTRKACPVGKTSNFSTLSLKKKSIFFRNSGKF